MSTMKTLTINGVKYDVTPVVPATSVTLLERAWVDEGEGHSQVVEIPGVTPSTKVDLQPTAEQLVEFHDKILAFVAENDGGVVTVYAIGHRPTGDHTIQTTLTEVEGTGKIRGNTVGTTMPNPDWNQTDPTKADYIKNKPTYTAQDVGARPDTWMPTAAQVGARPDNWMPTASDVGAAPAKLVDGFYTVADGTDEAFLEVINTVYASMPNRSVRYIVVAFSKAHPIVGGSTYIIKISRVYAEYGTLEMSSYSGLAFCRTRSDNSWQPLECVNPNLSLGKEYRTTERSNGKVVYAQAVDFGAMPDTSYKERYLNDGITGLVRVEGECKYHDGTDSAPFATVSFIGEITIIGGNTLKVTTTQNASSWVGYPVVYYVKS